MEVVFDERILHAQEENRLDDHQDKAIEQYYQSLKEHSGSGVKPNNI